MSTALFIELANINLEVLCKLLEKLTFCLVPEYLKVKLNEENYYASSL